MYMLSYAPHFVCTAGRIYCGPPVIQYTDRDRTELGAHGVIRSLVTSLAQSTMTRAKRVCVVLLLRPAFLAYGLAHTAPTFCGISLFCALPVILHQVLTAPTLSTPRYPYIFLRPSHGDSKTNENADITRKLSFRPEITDKSEKWERSLK